MSRRPKVQRADATLAALWAVATDDEAGTVTDLAVRAGLLWRCSCPNDDGRPFGLPCGYVNAAANDHCEGCGTPRAKAED